MSTRDDELALPALCRELSLEYGVVAYHRVWVAILAGAIPATRKGRAWFVRRTDLPKAAEALGLTRPVAA